METKLPPIPPAVLSENEKAAFVEEVARLIRSNEGKQNRIVTLGVTVKGLNNSNADANNLITILRDEITLLKEANSELAAQRIRQDQLYQDLKNQACADCARLQNRIAELEA